MTDQNDVLTISEGSNVLGSDNEKVGKVERVESTYIVVSKGMFFPSDHFIPVEAIANVTDGNVFLTVTKDDALKQGWETEPVGGSGVTTPMGGTAGTSSTGPSHDDEPLDHEQDSTRTHVNEDDNLRVDRSEEELTATTRGVERGGVTVDKTVVEEERQLDVPVTEERVNVSRRTVDRDVKAGDDAFTEGKIDVPVYGEEVDVDKRARVVEEIDIDKEAVTGTQRVSDTVRREEVNIDESGMNVTDRDKAADSGRGKTNKRR